MTEKEIIKQITRYIQGELNQAEEDNLWVEFLENPGYYRLFETELNLYDLYHNKNFRLKTDDNKVKEPATNYTLWTSIIAAAALLIVSGLYLFEFRSTGGYQSLALSEVELTEMIGVEVYRDQNTDLSELNRTINRSVSMALNGEPGMAIRELHKVSNGTLTGLQRNIIRYNLGILFYNTGELDFAEEYFTDVIENSGPDTPTYIVENADWYRANVLLKQEKISEVKTRLKALNDGASIHSTTAGILLDQINERSK